MVLPLIQLSPPENEGYQFQFIRKQFPIRLYFAMTINKDQAQAIHNVGLYFPNMFSHMVNCTWRYREEYLCLQQKHLS